MDNKDDIEKLIREFNREILFENKPPKENLINKDTIKIISIRKITGKGQTTIPREAVDNLKLNIEDEILFILDENGIISVRKSTDKFILGSGEKFISSTKIGMKESLKLFITSISKDVSYILKIKQKDNILWILEDNNIIIKNTILSSPCTISGEVLGLTTISNHQTTTIPTNVRDLILVETGDVVIFAIKNGKVIIKNLEEDIHDVKVLGMERLNIDRAIYLRKEIKDIINTEDKILWFFDKTGDIVIRNNFLPRICKY